MFDSLGCYVQGMARAHDVLIIPLWLGGTAYLVWLFSYCDVISVHCDVVFSMFIYFYGLDG